MFSTVKLLLLAVNLQFFCLSQTMVLIVPYGMHSGKESVSHGVIFGQTGRGEGNNSREWQWNLLGWVKIWLWSILLLSRFSCWWSGCCAVHICQRNMCTASCTYRCLNTLTVCLSEFSRCHPNDDMHNCHPLCVHAQGVHACRDGELKWKILIHARQTYQGDLELHFLRSMMDMEAPWWHN